MSNESTRFLLRFLVELKGIIPELLKTMNNVNEDFHPCVILSLKFRIQFEVEDHLEDLTSLLMFKSVLLGN